MREREREERLTSEMCNETAESVRCTFLTDERDCTGLFGLDIDCLRILAEGKPGKED